MASALAGAIAAVVLLPKWHNRSMAKLARKTIN
jgi:hypothetical protein